MTKLRIQNFDTYFGRSGIKNPTWFCMDVSFLTRREHFRKLTKNSLVVFVYLVGECVKAKTAEHELIEEHAVLYCMMTAEEVAQAIDILESVRLVSISRADRVQNLSVVEERREEERREVPGSDEPAPPPIPDVEELKQERYDFDDESVNTPLSERPMPKIIQLWNLHADKVLARVKMASSGRKRLALNRWKENPSEEFWSDVIWRINRSSFCLGKSKGGWKANIDFLLRPDTAAKVLEGKYDNPGGPGAPDPSTPKLSYWARQQAGGEK